MVYYLLYSYQILLVKCRKAERWKLPGGGLEPTETASITVVRELKEEVRPSPMVNVYRGAFRGEGGIRSPLEHLLPPLELETFPLNVTDLSTMSSVEL